MKIHIVSGFLGAGKTTFINKWLPLLKGKVCLIENEFGDICIDSNCFDQEIEVKEIYAGCICCSLVGDFMEGITQLYERFSPEHLIIEPSGVSNLSDVLKICKKMISEYQGNISLGKVITLVEHNAFLDYVQHFGAFYTDQIRQTSLIALSHSCDVREEDIMPVIKGLLEINNDAYIIKEDWITASDELFKDYIDSVVENEIKTVSQVASRPANQLLESMSVAYPRRLSLEEFTELFEDLLSFAEGRVLRAKGFIALTNKKNIQFNYTPFHKEWSYVEDPIQPGVTFIGSGLKKDVIGRSFMKQMTVRD